ncbi:SGNH hydrolase-type esterase superfamily protein [Trifolium repens]|jgi:hypothetical protein|nr:SGNH hydrolase-type esterase superfamily protein [Trifolium repens]
MPNLPILYEFVKMNVILYCLYMVWFDNNIRFCLPKCSDGLHLTSGGNQLVFEEVIRKLRDEGLSLESIPIDLPLLSDVDRNDPLKAFL